MLIGRGSERAAVDALLDDARAGSGGTLVLRGDPGIGKTALLEYAVDRAHDFVTLRALGVETESELAYSALLELLGPLLGTIDDLPPQQAQALRAALGLERAEPVERFGVYVAILGLLAAASVREPLLCVVDDAQWVDRASAEALRFVSRRLRGDRVAFLAAAREGETRTFDAPELPELYVQPLHEVAAAELLDRSSPDLAPELRRRVLEASGGNPLALLEIPQQAAPLVGEASPLPVGRRVEHAFLGRVRALSPRAQQALLVAAAAELTEGAAVRAVVDDEAIDEAERSGLLTTEGGMLRFAHPLVRSAVYSASDSVDRRSAHKALAAALAAAGETELAAWQTAAAASAPDEDVAAALERAAESAGARGGEIVQAHALERAARLTPDRDRRARRLLESAKASWSIGLDRVETLCREALQLTDDPTLEGEVHAQLETALYWRGDLPAAHRIKVETADALEGSAPVQAAHMRARSTASLKHMLRGQESLEAAERAMETMRAAGGEDPRVPLMYAQALARCGDTAQAGALVEEWTRAARAATDSLLMNVSDVLVLQDDVASAETLLDEWLRPARAAGDVSSLSNALVHKATMDSCRGRFVAAHAAARESYELSELVPAEMLQRAESAVRLSVVLSLLGREDDEVSTEALRLSALCSSRFLEAEARAGLGRLELSLGRPGKAIDQLEHVRAAVRGGGYRHPAFVQFSPDLVLAYVRAGRLEDANEEVRVLSEEAESTGMPWALAAAARSRALLAPDDDFDEVFAEAAAHHSLSPRVAEAALTQLLYGERLRRTGRRTDARVQLRASLETFEAAGAAAWSARARDELAATGEHVRPAQGGRDHLTPQELQVAYAVSAGATNKEAAAQLFLSTKTIEFHLRNAYRKLGVRSRVQLARALEG